MPEKPSDLSTYKGYRFRKLNRQAASRLVELFQLCKCSLCGAPLEKGHLRMLLSEQDLLANDIQPWPTKLERAHIVRVPDVGEPILFCDSDYSAWLDPAKDRNRYGL